MNEIDNIIRQCQGYKTITKNATQALDFAIDKLYLTKFENLRYSDVKSWIYNQIDIIFKDSKINISLLKENVDMTQLVEDCCAEFSVDFIFGPLDDSEHWIWSDPFEILNKFIEHHAN